jgi:hypothetical protein
MLLATLMTPYKAIKFVLFAHKTLVNSRRLSWLALGSRMNMMKHTVLCSMLAVQAGCGSESGQSNGAPVTNEKPDVVLESVKIGTRSAQFYVDFGSDSAILGFSVENGSGQQQYFPIYGSTYRGLPSVMLDLFVSDSQEEMWVHSTWSGYEILAYYRMGTDRCMTRYGEITSFDKPTPESLGGGTSRFPEMDIEKVSKVATLKYDGKSLTR